MPDRRCRKLRAVRSAVRMEPSAPTILAASSPGSSRAPSGATATYSQGGRSISKTRAAASAPLRTPALLAVILASPMRSGPTTKRVVTSPSPRSSLSAAATTSSSASVLGVTSDFDETIGLLSQSERLLGEPEEVRPLASNAALLPRRFDDAAVDDLAPEVASVD